jgi:hypothetical protein
MVKFKFCILFGDSPDLDPAQIAPGWEMAEIPVGLVVRPFDSEATWEARHKNIQSWSLPPIKAASHFIHDWGLTPIGPAADWDQLQFWSERALRRLAGLGVEFAGVYGNFFKIPDGMSRTRAMEDAIHWVNMLADFAEKYKVKIALEPTADPDTLFPMYIDALEFARKEIGREVVRVMADLNYFIHGNQPLEHIAKDPAYCLHVHIRWRERPARGRRPHGNPHQSIPGTPRYSIHWWSLCSLPVGDYRGREKGGFSCRNCQVASIPAGIAGQSVCGVNFLKTSSTRRLQLCIN